MSLILIADDDAQNLYLVNFLLKQKGHSVVEARDGREVVAAAMSEGFELILMDIQMPVMNGLDATRLIKQYDGSVKIIALTAKAMAGDRELIVSAGCDGYIEKPIDPLNFIGQVEGFLGESRCVS